MFHKYWHDKVNKNRWECPVMTQRILWDDFTAATVKDAPGEAFSVILVPTV